MIKSHVLYRLSYGLVEAVPRIGAEPSRRAGAGQDVGAARLDIGPRFYPT